MTEVSHPLATDTESRWDRLPSPTYLWFLGLLSLPAILFDRLELLRPLAFCFLFGFWPFVAGLFDGVTDEEVDPIDWLDTGDTWARMRALVSFLLLSVQPVVAVTGLLQILGQLPMLARYRGDLPAPESYDPATDFRLPFDGEWTVVNGSSDERFSHSWSMFTQRYAYDFVIADADGRTHEGERTGPDAHDCFGEPILAPAEGTVVETKTGHRDHPRTNGWLDLRQRDIRGNYVTIEHDGGEYSVLAHLQRDSVTVNPGDWVERGQRIGRCGNSGNTSEPHLHFHVQDHPNFFLGMGLPVPFVDLVTRFPATDPTHHDRAFVHAGQLVAHDRARERSN